MPPAATSTSNLPPVSPMSVGQRSLASALDAVSKRSITSNNNKNHLNMEWKHLQPTSAVARQDMASVAVTTEKGNTLGVLVVGGRSTEESALSTAQLFDWSSKRWRPLPALQNARCGCAVASVGKTFYVFGGVGAENETSSASQQQQQAGEAPEMMEVSCSVEVFSMGRSKAWNTLTDSSMPEARWHPGAVALPSSNTIIVLGGRDPEQWTELDSAVMFDAETKTFKALPNMSMPRFACGAARISPSTIFVAGGYNGSEWTSTCEIYDSKENEWSSSSIAEMPVQDLEFVSASTLMEDFVLVSGQRSNVEEGSVVVMVYCISKNEWTTLNVFPPSVADELAGSTMACVDSKYLLAVGGTSPEGLATKNTRITSNLLDVLNKAINGTSSLPALKSLMDDNCTIATYNSKGNASNTRTASTQDLSGHYHSSSMYSPSGSSIKKEVLDMTSPYHGTNNPVRHIDIFASCSNSMTSGLTNFDEFSRNTEETTSDDDLLSPTGSRRRQTVQNFEMVDMDGMNVVYNGSVVKGKPYGKGRMSWQNGDCYNGGFKHGQRHGKGRQMFADGKKYEGRFISNFAHDPNGNMTFNDGTIYVGAFVQGRRTGMGVLRFPSGVRYEGEFVNGKYHGQGSCCFADGSMYEGEWIHGTAHGMGTLKDNQGAVLYSGLWQNDSPVDESN